MSNKGRIHICFAKMLVLAGIHSWLESLPVHPKSSWFQSQSRHIPMLQVWSQSRHIGEATHGCFSLTSLFLFLFSPFSLSEINNNILGWRLKRKWVGTSYRTKGEKSVLGRCEQVHKDDDSMLVQQTQNCSMLLRHEMKGNMKWWQGPVSKALHVWLRDWCDRDGQHCRWSEEVPG